MGGRSRYSGYVHPRAHHGGSHVFALECADESTPNYHRWIASLCRPHLGARVLEVGAGYGAVTRFMSEGVKHYVATDADPGCVRILQSKFHGSPNVTVRNFDAAVDEPIDEFDSIVMINVLEHLHDDAGILESLSLHLVSRGKLVVYVPALNSMYGDWDRRAGHYRRYSRRQLRHVFQDAGLAIAEVRYANLMAIPAWFAFSRLGIRRAENGPAARFRRDLRLWDNVAVPLTQRLESTIRVPIGLNLLGVASKPTRTS